MKDNDIFWSREAKIGASIFGPVPKNHKRAFLYLDNNVWLWRDEWLDKNGIRHIQESKYYVTVNGLKKVTNGVNIKVSQNEARNFFKASEIYFKRVSKEIYGLRL